MKTKVVQTHFIPTSQLKLYDVVNANGEDLGQVQNFIIDMCAGRIAYVLVAFEGFLGLSDKWIPLPFDLLTWMPEKSKFSMDVPRKTMEKAPTISKSEWPDKFLGKLEMQDHSVWLESVYDYFNCTPYWIEYSGETCGAEDAGPVMVETTEPVMMETATTYVNPVRREAVNVNRLQPVAPAMKTKTKEAKEMKSAKKMETHFIPTSRLKSYDIVGDMGEDLGQVERIIVDMCSGKVAYMLVGVKGLPADRWVAVPPDAMTWQPDKHRFVLDIQRNKLMAAPSIPKADWPDKFLANLEDEDHVHWLEDVYTYYDYEPFWLVVETEA